MFGWESDASDRGFPAQALLCLGVAGGGLGQELERDAPAQALVFREEDLAHAALAQGPQNPVVEEALRPHGETLPARPGEVEGVGPEWAGPYRRPKLSRFVLTAMGPRGNNRLAFRSRPEKAPRDACPD